MQIIESPCFISKTEAVSSSQIRIQLNRNMVSQSFWIPALLQYICISFCKGVLLFMLKCTVLATSHVTFSVMRRVCRFLANAKIFKISVGWDLENSKNKINVYFQYDLYTVEDLYYGHPWDQKMCPLLADVHNRGVSIIVTLWRG